MLDDVNKKTAYLTLRMILSFCIFLTNIIFLCRWENLTFVVVRASTGLQLVLNIGTLSVVF